MIKKGAIRLFFIAIFLSGCGYTTRSLLGPDIKSVYVESFANRIMITAEQSDERMYTGYRPGLETETTRAVMDKFLADGSLKIGSSTSADLILRGELTDFRKEPLRYDVNDTVEEYRIIVTLNLELEEASTGKVMWREKNFSGEATYRVSGSLAKSESFAVSDAIADLARRVVERVIEGW